jgi:transposase
VFAQDAYAAPFGDSGGYRFQRAPHIGRRRLWGWRSARSYGGSRAWGRWGDAAVAAIGGLLWALRADLLRCREDLRGDLMRARHRLTKLLLRHGLRYLGPGRNWTVAHHRWLESLRFADLAAQASFVDYLVAVDGIAQRRGVLDRTIDELVPESPYAEPIARLRCFRGIDTLSAAGICAEVGDFARFRKPKLLAGHLGITPSERTSDERRRQGGITKAGSKHARRLLVEAAHHYARPPKLSTELRRRQDGQDPRVCEVS